MLCVLLQHVRTCWIVPPKIMHIYAIHGIHEYVCVYTYDVSLWTYTHIHTYNSILCVWSVCYSSPYTHIHTYNLIERNPSSRGGFLFNMFPDQEPCVRDFTTKCDRRISSWNLGGGVSFDQSVYYSSPYTHIHTHNSMCMKCILLLCRADGFNILFRGQPYLKKIA